MKYKAVKAEMALVNVAAIPYEAELKYGMRHCIHALQSRKSYHGDGKSTYKKFGSWRSVTFVCRTCMTRTHLCKHEIKRKRIHDD